MKALYESVNFSLLITNRKRGKYDVSKMLLSMVRSLQVFIAENIRYISVSSELFKKNNANLHIKVVEPFEHLATVSAFA